MGIYIKKVLGYGLQMTIDEDAALINEAVSRKLMSKTGENYIEFLTAKYANTSTDDINYHLNDLHSSSLASLAKYTAADFITVVDNGMDGEQEGDTVWVVITPPLVCKDWKHNADPIDYYEQSYKYQDIGWKFDQNLKFINQGLFPYEGSYINHATGDVFNSSLVSRIRAYLEIKGTPENPEEEKTLGRLLTTVKVSSVEEFKTVIHPAPPTSVVDIAEWTGIFKDSSTAPRLRPCLLQHWS